MCFLKEGREKERGKEKHFSPFLGPLQEGMAPICPTLTFERISDYTGERGRQEVSEEKVLHRGLWHGSDTLSLQQ